MITAALPYANGPVHIGHLAGVYIPADVYARFQRRSGKDVAFICGSDEHGIPITIRAKKKGLLLRISLISITKLLKNLLLTWEFHSMNIQEQLPRTIMKPVRIFSRFYMKKGNSPKRCLSNILMSRQENSLLTGIL